MSLKINRRHTQKCADSIFSLADQSSLWRASPRQAWPGKTCMPFGQTGYYLLGMDFSTMPINGSGNLTNTLKTYLEAIDGFLPAGSAGKKVCVSLRQSAVKKYHRNPLNPV